MNMITRTPLVGGVLGSSFTPSFDPNGNMINDGMGLTASYDASNRMISANKSPQSASFGYGALGQRVFKASSSSGTQIYMYDVLGRPLGVYKKNLSSSNGVDVEEEYLHLDGWRVVGVVRPHSTSGMTTPQIYPVLSDHLGTPRKILNSSTGQSVWEWDAKDPFGHQLPHENPSGLGTFTFDLRFLGQRFDKETGLFHNNFRDYHPSVRRYMQSDPLGLEAGWNSYGYVGNNPLSFTDTMGLACDQRGCWNTEEELKFAESGDWDIYYDLACRGGDTYTCRAKEVASGTSNYFPNYEGAMFTNYRLETSILKNNPNISSCELEERMENIRVGLMRERIKMMENANKRTPFTAKSKDISDFHRKVFSQYGADPNIFGGDMLGRNNFSHKVVNGVFPWSKMDLAT